MKKTNTHKTNGLINGTNTKVKKYRNNLNLFFHLFLVLRRATVFKQKLNVSLGVHKLNFITKCINDNNM